MSTVVSSQCQKTPILYYASYCHCDYIHVAYNVVVYIVALQTMKRFSTSCPSLEDQTMYDLSSSPSQLVTPHYFHMNRPGKGE